MTLPNFPGAETVYRRAETICQKMNANEYKAQRAACKNKRFRFHPSSDACSIIDAMNRGDEEMLKAAIYAYRNLL